MTKSEVFKRNVVKEIIEKLEQNQDRKIKIDLPAGCGGTSILVDVIAKRIDKEKEIIVLADCVMICEQFKAMIEEEGIADKVRISTYQSCCKNGLLQKREASLIICRDIQNLDRQIVRELETLADTKIILMETIGQRLGGMDDECTKWLASFNMILSYSVEQAIEAGYSYQFYEYQSVEIFCTKMLRYLGYQNIRTESTVSNLYYNMIAEKKEKYIFEIKYYKSLYNSQQLMDRAIEQMLKYKREVDQVYSGCQLCLIMFCRVDKKIKLSAYARGIIVWDIANILYLCRENSELMDMIPMAVSFPITDIEMEEPLADREEIQTEGIHSDNFDQHIPEKTKYEIYKKQLEDCTTGKKGCADKQYEKICAEIIKELFEDQFSRTVEQSCTSDKMFRMDLLCSLKGGTAFWNDLIKFYRTKYVVFEFKNYEDLISQNLIYISEKYLYAPALRNVAFIVSRKGFSPNAKNAVKGCLIEDGKLILELKDEDLLCMLNLKDNGQEPSDYLMQKMDDFLMGISK